MADVPYEAFVRWWDTQTLAAICPLCSEVECHDVQFEQEKFDWDKPLRLTALCRSTGVTYEAIFPWKIGLGWEKGWRRKRLQTIGLDLSKLGIRDCRQPTLMTVDGPPLRAKEDPLFWGTRVTKSYVEDSMLHLNGHQGNTKANESEREGQESVRPTRLEMPVLPFSPQIVLGDMRLIRSQRPKSTLIQMLAPAATIRGSPLPGPLAWVKSNATLKHKTGAVLDRRGAYPPIVAISGWKDFSENTNNVIDQDFWSREVREISECLSHKLDAHNLDHGIRGRACSSHAEKQLIAFVVRMHCFLKGEFEEARMAKLKIIPPHLRLREAWIGVDTPPCDNCKAFKKSVEKACDIRLHFVIMKKELKFRKDSENNIEEPSTPMKSKTAKFLPLTPPDSGRRLSKEHAQPSREERIEESSEDEYIDDEDGDPESPCNQRALRSLAPEPRPSNTKDNTRRSKKPPASRQRDLPKRPRTNSDSESDYTPPSSQPRQSLHSAKKLKPSLLALPTPQPPSRSQLSPQSYVSYSRPTAPPPRRPPRQHHGRQPHHRRRPGSRPKKLKLMSGADTRAAVDEVSDALEWPGGRGWFEEEKEEEVDDDAATVDSDTPIAMPRRTPKLTRLTPERVVIDLTGETAEEDGDESEGSCFSP